MYTRDLEDLPVVMKPLECSVKCVEGVLSEHILTRNIAEVKECVEGLCDISVYIALE